MKVWTVATRRGELPVAQMRLVIASLKAKHPELEIRIQETTIAGGRDRKTALWNLKDAALPVCLFSGGQPLLRPH